MKKIFAYLVVIAALVSACSKNLDIDQHGVLTYDNFYNTDEEIESANLSMYTQMLSMEYTFLADFVCLSDDFWAGGGVRGDNPILERMNEFTFDAENDYINSVFSNMYTLIYKANVVLAHVDESKGEAARRARAEAKVFRAWAYFYLTANWGNPPLVDHELASDEYWQGNTPASELWAFIENDLKEAINSGDLVEKTSLNDDQTWRLTKQVAQAMLGKAYIWQEKWTDAQKVLDEVIESGKYDLFTAGEYGDMNRIMYKRNCESMIELNRPMDAANPSFSFTMTFCTTGWRVDKMYGYFMNGISVLGWGFMGPQRGLYDAFVAREGADGYRLNQTMKTLEQLNAMGIGINEGEDIPSDGVFMWKWRSLQEECVGGSPFYCGRNIRYMRFAEVLLLAAEAHLHGGSADKATKYVNRIRTRAKLDPLASVTMEDVKIEKRLELCGEHTRYMDLIRWGDAYDALKDQGAYMPYCNDKGVVTHRVFNTDSAKYGFKKGKHELLPYPASEIRTNPNIVQNPGY